ncbi:hypothetical protein DPX16_8662 [Anabarilius grahami]|uniref:CCHC-type domain-containing protein n=1 Tax=Anabarilius grahami TaxID=495550 RepID=A0A3N0Y941_ANAGA|nr:hypothetical protein DPX16_8662 [Anabarilius grahami]
MMFVARGAWFSGACNGRERQGMRGWMLENSGSRSETRMTDDTHTQTWNTGGSSETQETGWMLENSGSRSETRMTDDTHTQTWNTGGSSETQETGQCLTGVMRFLQLQLMQRRCKIYLPALVLFYVLLRDQFIEHVFDTSLLRELKQLVRRQPIITLLDVQGEAMRWEQEGIPGGARSRSYSVPSAYGHQYGVQGGSSNMPRNGSLGSDLGDLKDILKQQQDQLNQLTQSIALLQNNQRRTRQFRDGPVICRRCQRPGHFARECDGERVAFRPRSNSVASPLSSPSVARPSAPQQGSEN